MIPLLSRLLFPSLLEFASGFLEGPQHGVHPGLIADALRFEARQHVSIHPQGNKCFGRA